MESNETLEALRFVLGEKIYPRYPETVRNNTRASELVCDFVEEMQFSFDRKYRRYPDAEITKLLSADSWTSESDHKEFLSYAFSRPLRGLTEGTVRKYISVLWRSHAFEGCLKFELVK